MDVVSTRVSSTRSRLGLLAIALVLLATESGFAQSRPRLSLDIVYGKAGERDLKLDLARPDGPGPFPVVVCIHGGGWRMGNKRDMRDWIKMLALEGYAAASIGYRLVPDAVFPAQIEDCKTAVRFLRSNAAEYDLDRTRFAAMGYSAGGHLACLLGLTNAKQGFEGKQYPEESSAVRAVVDFYGPTDLAGFAQDETAQRGMLGPLIGKKYAEDSAAHDRASPIRYVHKNAPPFLILHGTKDRVVPIDQSRRLHDKLRELGVKSTLVEVPDEGHGWNGRAAITSTEATLKFLAEHLKK